MVLGRQRLAARVPRRREPRVAVLLQPARAAARRVVDEARVDAAPLAHAAVLGKEPRDGHVVHGVALKRGGGHVERERALDVGGRAHVLQRVIQMQPPPEVVDASEALVARQVLHCTGRRRHTVRGTITAQIQLRGSLSPAAGSAAAARSPPVHRARHRGGVGSGAGGSTSHERCCGATAAHLCVLGEHKLAGEDGVVGIDWVQVCAKAAGPIPSEQQQLLEHHGLL